MTNPFAKKIGRVALIVQCRLSSSRLPGKALLKLADHTILEWVLLAMKKVQADSYYLATDSDSAPFLKDIAQKCGFSIYVGSLNDVLDRFCKTIEECKADTVIRATADNPFLFYEAAQALLDEYSSRIKDEQDLDYITWTGLPHGSGVEIFNAHSLLKAAKLENLSPRDHEHVGPALYEHKEVFNCLFLRASDKFYFPNLRTTVDTPADYRRARALVRVISSKLDQKDSFASYPASLILEGLENPSVKYPMLFVPCTKKGRGTGHLRRCLDLTISCGADIYIPKEASLEQCNDLIAEALEEGLSAEQIVDDLEIASDYSLVVTDLFKSDADFAKKLSAKCPIVALDEGEINATWADYLLDIIPPIDLKRQTNRLEPNFISLPKHRRAADCKNSKIHTALVSLGGEDPANLTKPAIIALAECGVYVSAITDKSIQDLKIDEKLTKYVKLLPPQKNLKEKLYEYDLIVTHYGFTAFESCAAGCAVILLATTSLHEALAKKYSFTCLKPSDISAVSFKKLLAQASLLYRNITPADHSSLADFLVTLSKGKRIPCPICRKSDSIPFDTLVARTPERTFRRCKTCGMLYMSWTVQSEQTEYNRAYFYEDYKKQYGKTYEDDFESIKAQCVRRVSLMDFIYRKSHSSITPTVLDIGCALGPFLDAANDSGWQVFGADTSSAAVDYVKSTLHYPAALASFPDIDTLAEFSIDKFDAVTMWYVIEHFQNLDSVLKKISSIIKKGGIFAFSTPSASGVSGKFNRKSFFESSPSDHYTLWETEHAAAVLKKYGFKVVKIVSTGIHPERFPSYKKHSWKNGSLQEKVLSTASRIFRLGDTFEVYCKKVR